MEPQPMLRSATVDDIEHIVHLWKQLYVHHQSMGFIFSVDVQAALAWSEGVKKQLGRFQFVWVTENQTDLNGFLAMRLSYAPAQYGRHLLAHISELYVARDARNMGLGRRLAQEALLKAHELRVHSLEVQAMFANAAARRFWKKLGFLAEFVQFRKVP